MVGPSPQLELKVSPSVEARREHTSQWQNVSPVNSSIIQVDVPGGTVYVVVGRLPIDGRYCSCDRLKCVPVQTSVLADWSNEVFMEKSSSCLFNFRPFNVNISSNVPFNLTAAAAVLLVGTCDVCVYWRLNEGFWAAQP